MRDNLLAELEESIIPHHVDLVNIDTAPSYFREVAMKEVVVWKHTLREVLSCDFGDNEIKLAICHPE